MAGEKAVSKVPKKVSKPQLRGLLIASIKRNLTVAITAGIVAGASFKVFVGNERKRKYAEFYSNYDAEKEFEKMKAAGVFQSC